MKNTISSLPMLAFGAFLLFLPGIISLKNRSAHLHQSTIREQLTNKWDIQSFTIDAVEVKGSVVKYSTLKFGTDEFNWSIHYKDDTSEHQSGQYRLEENERKIEIFNQKQEHFLFDMQLVNNELQLSGNLDGEHYVLKAKRDWK